MLQIAIFKVNFTIMVKDKIKQEVLLDKETIRILSGQAEESGKELSTYLEDVLREQAENRELSDEYKTMMDEMIRKHDAGELNFTPWSEFKKELRGRL